MFVVNSGFVGIFKLGDNINYNLRILSYCYERLNDPDDNDAFLLRKPVIIIMAGIAEALLYDLHFRMKIYTNEGVRGITSAVLQHVRGKKIDRFEHYIASAKKHRLLGDPQEKIYQDLDELRKLRNRAHIQNEKKDFEPDDEIAFSEDRVELAERTLEYLVKEISNKHPRPESVQGHVCDFEFPWDEHLR